MTDQPLDTPTNLTPTTVDTHGTTHVIVEIPLDVLMDDSSESVEEEKDSDEITTDLNVISLAVAALIDDDYDDPDGETSAPSTHHEPQGVSQGDDIDAVEDVSASSDNGSSIGTEFFQRVHLILVCLLCLLLFVVVLSLSSKRAMLTTHVHTAKLFFFDHGVASFVTCSLCSLCFWSNTAMVLVIHGDRIHVTISTA